MKNILESMEQIDDELLREAEEFSFRRKRYGWIKYCSIAACLLLIVGIGVGIWKRGILENNNNTRETESDYSEYKVYTNAVKLPTNFSNSDTMDMIGCVVYKGKVYVQTNLYEGKENNELIEKFVGEYIGEAKGNLDEWSSQSDFATELASTYYGSVYKVNGYSDDFRICIYEKTEDEQWIQFLDNYDRIGLNIGADLFEKRLHIKGNVESVTYVTSNDWDAGKLSNQKELSGVSEKQIEDFLNELCDSPFERLDDEKNSDFYYAMPEGHIYLNLKDGTNVELHLIDGGYVGIQSLGWVVVKMSGPHFDKMLAACQ